MFNSSGFMGIFSLSMALQTGKAERATPPTPAVGDAWHRMSNFLKSQLESEHHPQADAERILEGIRRQPESTQTKIISQFEKGNYEPLLTAKKLYYIALDNAIQQAINREASTIENNINNALNSALPGGAPATPAQPSLPKASVTQAKGACAVHHRIQNNPNDLSTTHYELSLDSAGNVQTTSKSGGRGGAIPDDKFTCVYLHNGKFLDRSGKEVRSVQWGNQQLSADRFMDYVEPIREGALSGVRDGFLKDLRLHGSQVVFTRGAPPATAPAQAAAAPQTSPVKASDEPTVRLPRPSTPSQAATALPSSTVSFHMPDLSSHQTRSVQRVLRINEAGDLQMKFRGAKGETIWGAPVDPSSGLNCACAYVDKGKLYDRSGAEIKKLGWGSSQVDASLILTHLEPVRAGTVSALKEGYLNRVTLNGQELVFTQGPPPAHGAARNGAATNGSQSGATPGAAPTTPAQVAPTRESLTKVSLSLPHGTNNYLGVPLECGLDTDGKLLVRRSNSQTWQRPADVELNFDGRKRGVTALYFDKGHLFRENGEEVRELSLAGNRLSAPMFEFGIFRFLDRSSPHPIFGMQPQYVNDVTSGDNQVIFVRGTPPGLR